MGHDHELKIARSNNFVFGTQIGNLAFFGYSGAHEWADVEPHANSFCAFVKDTPSVDTAVLVGHWDTSNLGCLPGMDVPSVYEHLMTCDVFQSGAKRLLY